VPEPELRRYTREAPWARFAGELVTALVSLSKHPRFSLPAVLSVALGIGASLAVFAVFSALMLRPLPFIEEQRLVRFGFPGASRFADPRELTVSVEAAERIRAFSTVFESVTAQLIFAARVELPGQPPRWTSAQLVDLHYFDTLRVPATRGRTFSAREPASGAGAVMREGCARSDFGGTLQLGQLLTIDGEAMPLLGFIADEQALPSWGCLWLVARHQTEQSRANYFARAIGRLAPGMNVELAQRRLRELLAELNVTSPRGEPLVVGVAPLRDTLVDAERSWLSLMLTAVGVFLLMACANLAALLATRAAVRQHERAVCAALGASRWVLARQALIEGFVLVAIGGLAGLGLAQLGVTWANAQYAEVLGNLPARLDARVLVALVLLVSTCTLFGSAAPILALRHVAPADALRAQGRASSSSGTGRIRRALVVVQVTAMVALSIDAGLLTRSLLGLLDRETGFSSEGVVVAKVVVDAPAHDGVEERFFRQREEVLRQVRVALERVRRLEGVSIAEVGRVPFDYASERLQMRLEPGALFDEVNVRVQSVGPRYFEAMGVQLLSGQTFGLEHEGWPPQRFAIVSRNFAEQALGVRDAVGHRLRFQAPPGVAEEVPWIRIIGTVDDTLEEPLSDPAPLVVYFPFFAYPNRAVTGGNTIVPLILKTTRPEHVMSQLPAALAEVLPRAPVTEVQAFGDLVRGTLGRRLSLAQVLCVLAFVALVLAAVGLVGVTSYSVAQRSRELAIRRVLGATRQRIRMLVLAETGALVGAGLVLGGLGAWLSRRLLGAFMYGVVPLDPLTYTAVAVGVALIAAFAARIAAHPILASNPARVLERG